VQTRNPGSVRTHVWRPPLLLLSGVFGVVLSAAACSEATGSPTSTVDCQNRAGVANVAFPLTHAGTAHNLGGVNLGHVHNEAVRDLLKRAVRSKPEAKTMEDIYDAFSVALRGRADSLGVNPHHGQVVLATALVSESKDRKQTFGASRLIDSLASDPEILTAVNDHRSRVAAIRSREFKHQHGGRNGSLTASTADSILLDEGVGDLMATDGDSTVDAATAIAATDDVADYWAGEVAAPEASDTIYAMEDMSDSSRDFWEGVFIDAWIASGGDTSIFTPIWGKSLNGSCDVTRTLPGQGQPSFIECPQCPAAAGIAMLMDVAQGWISVRGGQTGWDLAGDIGTMSIFTFMAAAGDWAVASEMPKPSLVTKVWNWVKGFFH
jgi:hypothetical protein